MGISFSLKGDFIKKDEVFALQKRWSVVIMRFMKKQQGQ